MDELIERIEKMREEIKNSEDISSWKIEDEEQKLYELAKRKKVDNNKLLKLIDFVESKRVVLKLIELIADGDLKREIYFKKIKQYILDYKRQKTEDEYNNIKLVREIKDFIEMLGQLSMEDEEKKKYIDGIIDNYKDFFYEEYKSYNYLEYVISDIIISFKNDINKIEYLEKLDNVDAKVKILKSVTDKEILMEYLNKNPEIRRALIRSIYMYESNRIADMWDFVKLIEAENEIIPHLLSNTRYKILKQFSVEILEDVKKYFNGNIPNVDTLSEYEKIGIDESTLTGKVVTNENQLNLNELQKKFFGVISGKFQNSKKKISIRDFGGTLSYNGDEKNRIETLEDLLKKSNRSEINLIRHSDDILFEPDDNKEKMGLRGIDGKFYVFLNGNHRLSMLKARYLTELKRAGNDKNRIEGIENEYVIYVSYAPELPNNNEEMIAIDVLADLFEIQGNGVQISELIEQGKKVGYQIFNKDGECIKELKTIEELKKYIGSQIQIVEKNNESSVKWQNVSQEYSSNTEYSDIFRVVTEKGTENKSHSESEFLEYMEKCAKYPETIGKGNKDFFIQKKKDLTEFIRKVIARIKKAIER